MSYKPLSQTVTDGQKNPISSDAVYDAIDAIPDGANTALSNLAAPTAVNQDLRLDAGKILSTNGVTVPTYTNSDGFQNDIFFRAGSIATYIRPGSQPAGGAVPWKQTAYLTNAYLDGQTFKRIVQGPAARLNISTGTLATTFPSLTFDYAVQGNAGTDVSWLNLTTWSSGTITTKGSFTSDNTSNVFDKAVLASGFACSTDNVLSIGLSQANRPRAGYFGKQIAIGQKDLTTGTRVSPAALYVRIPDVETITSVTSNVNDTNVITISGSVGGNIRFAVGDYIQLQGLPTVARVLSATNATGSPVTYTLDRNIGDGTTRNVLRYDAGFIVSKSDNTQIFEVDYKGDTLISNNLSINKGIIPSFTQGTAQQYQMELFGAQGSLISRYVDGGGQPNNREFIIGANVYYDANSPKRRFAGQSQLFVVGRGNNSYSHAFLHAENGAADSAISYNTLAYFVGSSSSFVLSSANRLRWATDNSGDVGNLYRSQRPANINAGSQGSFGAIKLNTGTGNSAPAGVLSSYGKDSVRTLGTTGTGAAITQISNYDGNSGGVHPTGVGDYVQAVGLPTISRISSITYNGNTPDIFFEKEIGGDGTNRNVVVHRPSFVAFSSTNGQSFTVRHDNTIEMRANIIINDAAENYDIRVEGEGDENLVFVDASADKVGIGTATPAEKLEVNGNIKATSGDVSIATAGKGLKVAEGSNAKMGTATLSAGTFTVATTAVTNNSRIFLTVQSLGTVSDPKAIAVTGRTDGQDFTITSADNTDTSVVAWMIVEPA